jgi:transcription antitermination factor NusG
VTEIVEDSTEVALRWYIVHAYSNFEHKVKASLEERIALMGLEDKFGEILVPTEEVVEMKEGQKRRSERKFFPGYVLVQMEMDDETWHLVKEVPKVLGEPGQGRCRQATPESAVRARRSGSGHGWAVQRLQRRRGAGALREEPFAGCGTDIRSIDTG